MNRTVTFPDGSILTSQALNKVEMEGIFQDTLAQSIGLDPTTVDVYSIVRAGWQTMGQPAIRVDDDVLFVRCEPLDTNYSRLRNSVPTGQNPDLTLTYTDVHTRAWHVIITIYGPNSLDNARAVVTSMLDVPAIDTFLAGYNLYVNPDIDQPKRVPETFQGEWWERMDLVLEFNEQVTETFTVGTVGTVVVTTYDKDGQLTTQTITV